MEFLRNSMRQMATAMAAAVMWGIAASPGSAQQATERPDMITTGTETAIKKGLRYLANSQSTNGTWRDGGYPTAMTSLAGLALMAGGNTPTEGEYSRNVNKAVDALLEIANSRTNKSPDVYGVIADLRAESSYMHGHGFAMLFLGEAYGMERDKSRQEKIRVVLERAVTLTGRSQSGAGGWLYQANSNSDEGSVTVTQIQGLRSIRNAGISVPKKIIDNACKYIADCQQSDGGISYRLGMSGSQPPITSAAVAVMYSAGQYENKVAEKSLAFVKQLVKNNPSRLEGGHTFYSMLYTAQAMYLSSDENWKLYFPRTRDNLLRSQAADGSWNGDWVGTTYGTSIALVTLQLPYNNLPIFQR